MTDLLAPVHRRVLAVAVLLALAACRSGGAAEPRTTVPTAASTTTTTAVSYDVPAVIDVPYIEKVMAALDHVDGEAARRAATQRKLDPEFFKYYSSIYTDRYFKLVQRAWLQIAGDKFKLLVASPGDPETTVERVIRADSQCIFFQAKRDYASQLLGPEGSQAPRYVALVPLPPERNLGGTNPTPWIMSLDGRNVDGSEPKPEDECRVR